MLSSVCVSVSLLSSLPFSPSFEFCLFSSRNVLSNFILLNFPANYPTILQNALLQLRWSRCPPRFRGLSMFEGLYDLYCSIESKPSKMLPLVAYCSSDDSDSEQSNASKVPAGAVVVPDGESSSTVKAAGTSSPKPGNSLSTEDKPAGIVAKEVKRKPITSSHMRSLDFDLKILDTKRPQPIRITIPSLMELDKYKEPDKKPKLKPITEGAGLFSLLPEPKNATSSVAKVFMPPSVANAKRTQSKQLTHPEVEAKKQKTNILDDDEEGGEPLSSFFFSLSGDLPVPSTLGTPMVLSDITSSISKSLDRISDMSGTIGLHWGMQSQTDLLHTSGSTTPNVTSSLSHASEIEEPSLDNAALMKLCGARDRKKGPDLSEMIDVSGSSLIGDSSLQLAKELSKEQPTHSFKRKSECSSLQRRKHQITYLAEQAKAQELELRNNWAQNRMTRKQTQAKYGF